MDRLLPLPELPSAHRRAGLGLCRLRDGQVRFTASTPSIYVSSPGVRRGFCAQCGSTLSYEGERWPGEVHLHVGAFDDPSTLAPTGHAFAAERLGWLHLP